MKVSATVTTINHFILLNEIGTNVIRRSGKRSVGSPGKFRPSALEKCQRADYLNAGVRNQESESWRKNPNDLSSLL